MPPTPRRKGEMPEAEEHRPRRRRPHIAQEVAELRGLYGTVEYIAHLHPSVRHRAVGVHSQALHGLHPVLRANTAMKD